MNSILRMEKLSDICELGMNFLSTLAFLQYLSIVTNYLKIHFYEVKDFSLRKSHMN
jgi:hypothetical protein